MTRLGGPWREAERHARRIRAERPVYGDKSEGSVAWWIASFLLAAGAVGVVWLVLVAFGG
jgi:hypothetical protein